MTSKIRVEEIVDLIDFLCICGFPEEFEIMGRLIVDKQWIMERRKNGQGQFYI